MEEVSWVSAPKTEPPDADQAFVPLADEDGQEKWVLLATDTADGVTDADYAFNKGQQWASDAQ